MRDNLPAAPGRGAAAAALIYLPLHAAVLPWLLPRLFTGLGAVELNYLFYAVGVVYMLVFCRNYLRSEFDAALDAPWRTLSAVLLAYAVEFSLSLALSLALSLIPGGQGLSSPNNSAIADIAAEDLSKTVVMCCVMAPIVEEILFRGLLFGALRPYNRVLAWIISVAAFCLYHVWQYALDDPALLLSALLYLPGSLAFNFAYERGGSLWPPILYHALINLMAVSQLV